jgi:hypothetical protein
MNDLHDRSAFEARLLSLKQPSPDPDCLYHAITLTADDSGKVTFGTQTEWVGWTAEDGRYEIRQSRLVYADFAKLWEGLDLPYIFVHSVDELTLFLLAGGNALVEKSPAEQVFSRLLGPRTSIADGLVGFKDRGLYDSSAFRRAPTPRLRMQIFDRDDRRCKICGRRPDDNSDLVLHIHHIRPWEKGGVTEPSNLITLCHTCHSGLMPHEDHRLFAYIKPTTGDVVEQMLLEFSKEVSTYRRVGFFGNASKT